MSYSKVASILLYIVLGISILVVAFFYFGDNLVNTEEYEAKVEKIQAPAEVQPDFMQTGADTAAAEADTVITEEGDTIIERAETIPVEDVTTDMEPEEVNLTFFESLVYNKTDIALAWGYILVILAALFALIFSVVHIFSRPGTLVRTLIGLVVVAGVLLLAYSLGSDATLRITGYEGTDNRDPQVLKMVDTGLITTYFILGLALLSILYSEIAKYFK